MLIGEVAQQSGVSARMLRHYDAIGLLSPSERTASGYRSYTDDDLRRLFHVESLRSLGLSLAETGAALDDPGFRPPALLDDLIDRSRQRLAREENLLRRLEEVRSGEPDRWAQVLQLVPLLRGLQSAESGRRQSSALAMSDDEAAAAARTLAQAVLTEADANAAGALRWALRRAGDAGADVLVDALESPDEAVRRRAIGALAVLPGAEATAALSAALRHSDAAVRRRAAIETAARGLPDAVPELIDMVITGDADVEAAEALGAVARALGRTGAVVAAVVGHLDAGSGGPAGRLRLTQALAELPGDRTLARLRDLREDADPNVARTALYLSRLLAGGQAQEPGQ